LSYSILAGLLLMMVAPAAPSAAPPAASEPNPVRTFLQAADRNDFTAMQTQMDPHVSWMGSAISPAAFVKRIGNCYLRRVYSNNASHELIAAWMCAEGAEDSRVVLANLAAKDSDGVVIEVVREDRNHRPAPARAGSAFAN
jgi:hypothetical protein